ncbi:hypothetical protein BDR07DRAFT_738674 [Suillus spraguei]|nr:hypothetical protein BDR07DRAFT_738674 [Suillus spraguei]
MDRMFNSIILYTLENNALTSAATIISIVCWVTMRNLIFLGVHFVLSKLYANSLLATLNSRKHLQEEHSRRALSNELLLSFSGRYQPKHRVGFFLTIAYLFTDNTKKRSDAENKVMCQGCREH